MSAHMLKFVRPQPDNMNPTICSALLNRYLFILLVLIAGCKKHNSIDPAIAGYRITLLQGDGQTASIGDTLPKQLVFKLAKDGQPNFSGYLLIQTFDCDGQPLMVKTPFGQSGFSGYDQVLSFRWKLNATIGQQSLKAVLLDSLQVPRDSVTVMANAVQVGQGWHTSGCLPVTSFPVTFSQLPSGRVLAGLYDAGYPYYSNDEGVSWHAMKTFYNQYRIVKIIATAAGEVFLSAVNTGVFYSPDGGQTWQARSTGLPVSNYNGSFFYTKSGKLFVSTNTGVYLSGDKGLNWHLVSFGIPFYASFWDACSLSDGTIIALSDNTLIYSTDGGENWSTNYSLSSTAGPSCLFADDQDNVYIGIATGIGLGYGLYVSKNKMQAWTKVYTVNPPPGFDNTLSAMTARNGSYYFYASGKNLLVTTKDFTGYTELAPPVPDNNGRISNAYIVTAGNHVILSTQFFGIYYSIP